jgi:hypothetical protein
MAYRRIGHRKRRPTRRRSSGMPRSILSRWPWVDEALFDEEQWRRVKRRLEMPRLVNIFEWEATPDAWKIIEQEGKFNRSQPGTPTVVTEIILEDWDWDDMIGARKPGHVRRRFTRKDVAR